MIELLIVGLAFLVYWPSLRGQFVFDDIGGILNQPCVIEGDLLGCVSELDRSGRRRFRRARSLTLLTYALHVKVFGLTQSGQLSPLSFHVCNVLLHAATSIVLYRFLLVWMTPFAATLAAIVFTVHPLCVNAVANISGRSAGLSALFMLGSMITAQSGYWVASILLGVLALQTKEDAAILPMTIAALFVLRGNVAVAGGILAALTLIVVVKWQWFGSLLTTDYGAELQKVGYPPVLRRSDWISSFLNATVTKWPQWFVGVGQNPDPDVQVAFWSDWWLYPRLAILASIPVVLFIATSKVLWLAAIFLFVSPWSVYLLASFPHIVLEHRAYFSAMGMAILWGLLLSAIPAGLLGALLTVCTFAYFAIRTADLSYRWSDGIVLWEMARRRGSARKPQVLMNLGYAYLAASDLKNATKWLSECLKLNERQVSAWGNLGIIAKRLGDGKAALHLFKRSAHFGPKFGFAWFMLGDQYECMGRFARAETCFRKCTQVSPDLDVGWQKLGLLQLRRGRPELAEFSFTQALTTKPHLKAHLLNYGFAALAIGKRTEAMKAFERVPGSMVVDAMGIEAVPQQSATTKVNPKYERKTGFQTKRNPARILREVTTHG